MKKGKKPTRNQVKALVSVGLNPRNWLVFKKVDGFLHLIHRETGTIRNIPE
ncbi:MULTISPECIES: DUF6906 family protein [Cytobacillus]|uniref:DUF6906 family protein n=1 Tax=Cytobacillus TaxID=2675230 RepID=UPI0025A13DED|nr:hypothetical protein [Cytobacillus kochii]MDM5208440.1 hypothetical protein [Cytobacillus kochii]